MISGDIGSDLLRLTFLVCIGTLAGFSSGLLGIGGGVILNPILLFFLRSKGVPWDVVTHTVFGTSLMVIIFSSMASAYHHNTRGRVLWNISFPLAFASIAGSFAGSYVVAHISGIMLAKLFGFLLIIVSLRMLMQLEDRGSDDVRRGLSSVFPIGIITGFVSSMFGIGGGVVSIPLMVIILHVPVRKVAGTSSGAIIITATAGVLGYIYNGWGKPLVPSPSLGYVLWGAAIPLAFGSVFGARLGAKVNFRLNALWLRRVFALFLLFAAFRMIAFS
jgi:uncharacterized membrane protein YfcA